MSHFVRTAVCLFFAGALLAGPSSAQQDQPASVPADRRFYYNPLEQSIHWLRNEQIQTAIGLQPDQETKLDKIRQDHYARTQQIYQELRQVEGGQRYEKLNEMRLKLSKETEARVRQVLQKPQNERLRQIMLQLALQGQGGLRTMVLDQVAAELNITDNQKAKLRETENQARREMQEKIRKYQEKLQAEMLEKILGELDAAQRTKLEKMMGEHFELTPHPNRPGGAGAKAGT
jgi:hypothetical protein